MGNGVTVALQDALLRTTEPERGNDFSLHQLAKAAVAESVTRLVGLLAAEVADDEELRQVHPRALHPTGISGTKAIVSLLVLTDRRVLVAFEDQRDGVAPHVRELAYGQVAVRPKRLQVGVEVIYDPGGQVVVEAPKRMADDLAAALQAPPPVAPWLAELPTDSPPVTAAPVQSEAAAVPAGWHPDPSGRHELRYWDGAAWSAHVSDQQVQSSDPL